MKPTLQEQLEYISRTSNPNYIIIIKNKAGENMDFSQFKQTEQPKKQVKPKEKRYVITTIPQEGTDKTIILVRDTWFSNKEVLNGTYNNNNLEKNLANIEKKYKSEIDTI